MALVKANLKEQINSIVKNCPSTLVQAATLWSTAMFGYFSAGMAGPLTPLPSLQATVLQALFLKSMSANSFIDNLGSDLNTWLSAAVWVGPGFTPGTSVIASALPTAPLGKSILNGADAAETLSTAIDTWAKTIQVSAQTTSAPPILTILPLS